MTLRQSRKHVMRMLIGWNRPPVVATATTNNGQTLTLQTLMDTMRSIRNIAPPPVTVVMSPDMAHRFAQSTVNPELYGRVNIVVDYACHPEQAYRIRYPE